MSMRALVFSLSIPKYLLSRVLARLQPHRFFARASCLQLKNIEPPVLPGPDWVCVRVEACGICGSDLNALRGAESFSMEPYASFPAVMGHETIGRVEICGANVHDVAVGTRVAIEPILPCAARAIAPPCRFCATGHYGVCENFVSGSLAPGAVTGFTRGLGGGFGEYVVAHRSQLFPIPNALPTDRAVLIDSIASALQPVATHLPANDQTVLVFGAGIIGLHTIQCLRAAGFSGKIFAVARHDTQAELAEKLGADTIIRSRIFETVAELTHARLHRPSLGPPVLDGGVDCVFDCVGSSTTIDQALRLTRKRGKVVLVGTAGTISGVDAAPLWFKEVTLIGSSMYDRCTLHGVTQRTYQHVIDLLTAGRFYTDGLVTHRFPLGEYVCAFNVALNKNRYRSVKVVLLPKNEKNL